LAGTIPYGGHFITTEKNPAALQVFEKICKERKTIMHRARRETKIYKRDMRGFLHIEFEDNVAIALIVAKLLRIKRAAALGAMQRALPDPGVLVVKTLRLNKKVVHFANLFAVNDRASFLAAVKKIENILGKGLDVAIVLNNRQDRPDRVRQFFNIAVNDVKAKHIFTLGCYEKQIQLENSRRVNRANVHYMGLSTKLKNSKGGTLLNNITRRVASGTLIIGAGNVHTEQAEQLLKFLEKKTHATEAH
jgi:poly-gamma-glutamate synthase PgsB/CapB